jgi:hypothetical protein
MATGDDVDDNFDCRRPGFWTIAMAARGPAGRHSVATDKPKGVHGMSREEVDAGASELLAKMGLAAPKPAGRRRFPGADRCAA